MQLVKILHSLNNITYIKTKIQSKLIKLNVQIGLKKFYLYFKRLFNLSDNLGEVFEYLEYYEELTFSYKKIEYILKDVKKTCLDLHN